MILLFAFIVSWMYEIFVVRQGDVSFADIYEKTIQQAWGWDKVLAGEWEFSEMFEGSWDEQEIPLIDESLSKVVSTWKISIADRKRLWITWSDTYAVIQYCTPGVELCKQAADSQLKEFLTSTLETEIYVKKPYLLNFWWLDERIRAWTYCMDASRIAPYRKEVYGAKKLSNDTLSLIGKRLKIQDFDTCIEESNARLALRSEKQQAKRLFDISALPSYIILDTDTWSWIQIPGLYNPEQITAELQTQNVLSSS